MKPSNFTIHPWSSVFANSESETIACNIMRILNRTGNTWRKLTWDEYKAERLKDNHFHDSERHYFDKVIGYTVSAETAILFSPTWAKALTA